MVDQVFLNYPSILNFFTPESYLDIGANKGQNVDVILSLLPSLKRLHLVEGCHDHTENLKQIQNAKGIPFSIELLSDTVKEVKFYTDINDIHNVATGNSYYKEDTLHFREDVYETRTTTTLDLLFKDMQFDLIKFDTQGSELDIIKAELNSYQKPKV